MRKRVKRKSKISTVSSKRGRTKEKKFLNTFSLILLAIVVFELILIANSVSVGNAVRSVVTQKSVTTATQPPMVLTFEQKFGSNWKVEKDSKGVITKAIGGSVNVNTIDRSGQINLNNIDSVSRTFLFSNRDLLKVNQENLKVERVFANGPVKVIRYQEKYREIPIYNSYTTIAYKNNNLNFYKTNYEEINVDTTPKIGSDQAIKNAKIDAGNSYTSNSELVFYKDQALSSAYDPRKKVNSWIPAEKDKTDQTKIQIAKSTNSYEKLPPEKTELVVFPLKIIGGNGYSLVYKIDFPLNTKEGKKLTYFVDAKTGKILYKYDNIRYSSISGNISGKIYPENPIEGSEIKPVNNEEVCFEGFCNYTLNGNYQIETSATNGNLNSEFKGSYADVDNYQQADANFNQFISSLPASVNIDWESLDSSYKNEESNVFYHFNYGHDFFTRGGAFDIYGLDNIEMKATVSAPGFLCGLSYDYCNACAGGDIMIFFGAGEVPGFGYCEATSLGSDIIYHEYTHNVVFSIYQGIDFPYWDQTGGMNEGWADYYAASITNDPVMGENIFPNPIRYLNNTKRYPEDYDTEPHAAGEVFSPALWEIRQAIGANLTDVLVINAMKLNPMSFSEFVDSMLIVDDDNGILSDGTPHINDICHAFWDNHGIISNYCAGHTQTPLAEINNKNIYFCKGINEINGTAFGSRNNIFLNYSIIYHSTICGDCSVIGNAITLLNNGLQPVNNGILGYLDCSLIPEGMYELELKVRDSIGIESIAKISFSVDRSLHDGFPVKPIYNYGNQFLSTPTIADLDGDRLKEVIVKGFHNVYVYENNGSLRWSRPMGGYSLNLLLPPPSIGDINGDDKKEVFVNWGQWPNFVDDTGLPMDYCLYGWDNQGNNLANFPVKCSINGYEQDISLNPILADLNNDGFLEIISNFINAIYADYPSNTKINLFNKLYVWDKNGQLLTGWPFGFEFFNMTSEEWSATPYSEHGDFVVADVDGDNVLEIVWLTDMNQFYVLNSSANVINEFFANQSFFDQHVPGKLFAADINKDNQDEIVKRAYGQTMLFSSSGKLVWDHIGSESPFSSWSCLSFGEFDGDEIPEMVLGTDYIPFTSESGETYIINSSDGSVIKSWKIDNTSDYPRGNIFENIIIDINNDRKSDIIAATSGIGYVNWKGYDYIYAWDSNGSILNGFPKMVLGGIIGSPAVDDLDGDGFYELVTTTLGGEIYVWDLNASYNPSTMDWPQYQHDAQHTGLYTKPYLCADANSDGSVNIADVVYLIAYIFSGGTAPNPVLAGDADGDGSVNIADAVYLIAYIFSGGPAPCHAPANYVKNTDIKTEEQVTDYMKNAMASSNGSVTNNTNQTSWCNDSDGGLNYYIKGTATNSSNVSFTDSCGSSIILNEYSCSGSVIQKTNYSCVGNYTCSNGICVQNCIPKTCSQLGKTCGSWSNSCNGTLNCGTCNSGYNCSNGICVQKCSWLKGLLYPKTCKLIAEASLNVPDIA